MRSLEQIKQEISNLTQSISDLKSQAVEAMALKLKDNPYLEAKVKELERSQNLSNHLGDDWFSTAVAIDFSKLVDVKNTVEIEALEDYLSEFLGLQCEVKAGILCQSIGPAIIINEEGDVLDQDSLKWIITSEDYKTKKELKALINAYMEKTGYFPSVVQVDRYGNANFVKGL